MDSCIFCRIIEGKLPSYKVFEGENVLAILDIAPVNYGHVLVLPRAHHKNLEEIPSVLLCELMNAVKKVGESLKGNLGIKGYNVILNNDPEAGQIVPHLHFHVIPRHEEDGLAHWPGGRYGDGEAQEISEKIKINKSGL